MDEKPTMSELFEYRRWREEQLDNAKRRAHHYGDDMNTFEKAMVLVCAVSFATFILICSVGILAGILHNKGVI